jgi:internalin A
VRLIVLIVAAAAILSARDPSGWIGSEGGTVVRDSEGQITSIDLRASWVTDSDLPELAALPRLKSLDLSLTRVTDHGLLQLKTAPAITDLNLYYAELVTDAGISAVKGWKHLRRLDLRGTKVTDLTLQQLTGVASLEALDVGYALITDVGLDPLASLRNLKELCIGGNKLTDNGLQPLRQVRGLTYLDVEGAQRTDSGLWSVTLTERGLDAIATMKDLRHLRLNGTSVSAPGLEKLRGLDHLEWLDLERCKRVGHDALPVLSSFKTLRRLDLTGTAVGAGDVAKLRAALPNCTIVNGAADGASAAAEDPL